jgi:hypothetical protein
MVARATVNGFWLLSGFGVVSIGPRDESGDEGPEERIAAAAGVVHELEEAEMGRQLLLRDAAVRSQPGAQQGPMTFGRVDVDLPEAGAIVAAGVLAAGVANGLVPITPALQARKASCSSVCTRAPLAMFASITGLARPALQGPARWRSAGSRG